MMKQLFLISIFLLGAYWSYGQTTINARVSMHSDDAEQLPATEQNSSLNPGDLDLESSDLELVDDASWNGTGQTVGIRFMNLDIPQGAVIESAYIRFTVKEAGSEETSLNIRAEASDNASTFENTPDNISSRPLTAEVVEWHNIDPWTTAGEVKSTPDLSTLVQVITSRDGWSTGNALSFIIEGTGLRSAMSYNEDNPEVAPELVVSYYIPGQLTSHVSMHSDDAEELSEAEQNSSLNPGDIDLESSDLELVDDASWNGTGQTVGIRFSDLGIPQGAVIQSAHINFTVKDVSTEEASLTIRAQNDDNASTFENTPNNISSRPLTSEVVEWNDIAPWTVSGEVKSSPDLSQLVQAVISRDGWSDGNALAFVIEGIGLRSVRSYSDANPEAAPQLVVHYLQEKVVQVPELVREIPDQQVKTGWGINLDIKPFFRDRDSELTYTATGPEGTALPAELNFSNGTFSGSFDSPVVLPVTVTAESEGHEVSDQFLIFAEPQQNRMLTKLGSIKLGSFDEGAAEISAFDETSDRLFVTNAEYNRIDVIDMKDPSSLQLVRSIDITALGASVTSVDVYNGKLAAAIPANLKTDNGSVYVFDTAGTVLWNVEVGPLPDMLTYNGDGTKILVANEGEPNDDYTIDPEGSVSIIDTVTKTSVTAGFSAFNGNEAQLAAKGVRIYGPGATVAQDVEPEYVTVLGDTAYVTLQENNAIAVVDIENAEVVRITGLGYKDHSLPGYGLDVPDTDEIYISNWPFMGMFLPDAIESYEVGGTTYLVTVNEGDVREYDTYTEETEIEDVLLDPSSFPDAERIQQVAGGLKISTAMADTTANGEYRTLNTFGTRSFTIWNAESGEIVFESGDMLEQITASLYPENFNASNTNFNFKNRSDDKGPEPEAVTLGEIDGRMYAFIGLERMGGIMVYDVTDPMSPAFIEYFNGRDFSVADDESDEAGDSGPEKVEFIPAAMSPTSSNLIVVSNEVSGTVTAYSLGEVQDPFTLNVFHNNDGESDLLPDSIEVHGQRMTGGGVGQFKYTLDSLRKRAEDRGHASVMLSSGDNFLAGLTYNASIANGVFYDAVALDSLNYDAIDLGNHDFDFGTGVLADFIQAFETNPTPYLSSNLSFENVPELQALADDGRITPSTVVQKNGEMIGIIGLTTPLLPDISSPGNTIVSDKIVDSVQKQADLLTSAGVNKLILISHLQSLTEELDLAGKVQGIDIIIAGGGDELLTNDPALGEPYNIEPAGTYPTVTNDMNGDPVYIVTTPGNYRYLGNLLVDFSPEGRITRVYNSDPVLITGQADSSLVEVVEDPVREYIGDLSTSVIAIAEDTLDFRRETLRKSESNGGNLFADALLWQARKTYSDFGVNEPQVAIQNSGGLRLEALVDEGEFTADLTYNIAAFDNILSVVEDVSPEKFLELIEHGVANAPGLDGRFPQIAGFQIVYDQGMSAGSRVNSITLDDGTVLVADGEVVSGAPDINIATIDFTAGGGDGYPFDPLTYTTLGATYQQAFYNYLTAEDGLDSLITEAQYAFGMNERIFVEVTQAPAVAFVDEEFDNCPDMPDGWVEYNSGEDLITCSSNYGNMEFNGYGVGEGTSWLISPRITFDAGDYTMSFSSTNRYDGPDPVVYYSTDYDGVSNPDEFSWTEISEASALLRSDNGSSPVATGEVDLSFLDEEAHIAFRYISEGSSSGSSSMLILDDVVINVPDPVADAGVKSVAEIQGSGDMSPYSGNKVETGGIVTAFFNGTEPYPGAGYNANIEGFYIQMPEGDGDINTSDGLFVSSSKIANLKRYKI